MSHSERKQVLPCGVLSDNDGKSELISVIVPVYNGGRYLRRCLQSVCDGQHGVDYEVIIVNDGSTDSSLDIAMEFVRGADSESPAAEVRVLTQANAGLSCARNAGIDVCRGNRIVFVDADDVLYDGALKLMSEIMTVSGDDMVMMGHTTEQSPDDVYKVSCCKGYRRMPAIDACRKILYQDTLIPAAWGKMYRRWIFDRVRFAPGLYYEDVDWCVRALFECRSIAYASTPVYFYRMHEESFLHKWSEKRLDVLTVVDNLETMVDGVLSLCDDGKDCRVSFLRDAVADRKFSANYNIFLLAREHRRRDVARRCWHVIRAYRRKVLFDRESRCKNRLGAVLSYLGADITYLVSRLFPKH